MIASEFLNISMCRVYDITQSLVVDNSPFVLRVASELSAEVRPPEFIVEYGVGSGLFGLPLLRSLSRPTSYHGIDGSHAMVSLLMSKTAENPPQHLLRMITESGEDIVSNWRPRSFNGSPRVLAQFLQYFPLKVIGRAQCATRATVLRDLTRVDGFPRVFLYEDFLGRDEQETRRWQRDWDEYVRSNYAQHPEVIERVREVSTETANLIAKTIARPDLIPLIRARRRMARGEMPVSLAEFDSLCEAEGLVSRRWPHPALPNFFLFELKAAPA